MASVVRDRVRVLEVDRAEIGVVVIAVPTAAEAHIWVVIVELIVVFVLVKSPLNTKFRSFRSCRWTYPIRIDGCAEPRFVDTVGLVLYGRNLRLSFEYVS